MVHYLCDSLRDHTLLEEVSHWIIVVTFHV